MAATWQPTTLVQCVSIKPWLTYPGCDEPGGCHDLTLGRIHEMLGIEARGSSHDPFPVRSLTRRPARRFRPRPAR